MEGCVLYMLLSPPFDAIIFPHSSLTIPQRLRGDIVDVWSIAVETLLDVSGKGIFNEYLMVGVTYVVICHHELSTQ